jgi:hypothetical protein
MYRAVTVLLFARGAGERGGGGVVLAGPGVRVAVRIVAELAEHPGAEDGSHAGDPPGNSRQLNRRAHQYDGPSLPRVRANPRVRDGELWGIHAIWADAAPGLVRTPGRRGRAAPGPGSRRGPSCPRRPMIRSQDRQLSGSGRKTGKALPAPGARLHGFTGTARRSVQAMILRLP